MEVLHCRYLFLGVFFSEHICIPAFATTQILSWLADGQACVFSKLLHSPPMPAYLILPLRNYCWQAGHRILPLVQERTEWSSFDARCHKNNLFPCFSNYCWFLLYVSPWYSFTDSPQCSGSWQFCLLFIFIFHWIRWCARPSNNWSPTAWFLS